MYMTPCSSSSSSGSPSAGFRFSASTLMVSSGPAPFLPVRVGVLSSGGVSRATSLPVSRAPRRLRGRRPLVPRRATSPASLSRIVTPLALCTARGEVYHPGDGGAGVNLWLRRSCRRAAPAFIAAAALCALARTASADEVLPCRDLFRPGLPVADAEGCGVKTPPRLRRADGASELLNLGIRHAEAGRHERALEALREAARLRPRWALAHYNIGWVYQLMQRWEEAASSCRTAISFDRSLAEAHYILGLSLEHLGKPAEAEASYEQALRLKPDYAEAHNNLGNTRLRRGEYKKALSSYKAAAELQPEMADAYNGMGEAYRRLGRLADAVEVYQTAVELSPRHAVAYHNLGVTLALMGRFQEGAEALRQAVALNPRDAEGRYNLGVISLEALKDRQVAEEQYEALRELSPPLAEKLRSLMRQ